MALIPENYEEELLVQNIDAKGQSVLDEGEPWSESVLVFTTDPNPTAREEQLISERLQYWERLIRGKNGVAREGAESGLPCPSPGCVGRLLDQSGNIAELGYAPVKCTECGFTGRRVNLVVIRD
jgi:hypothetical protein